jgi:hypothetical protein
VFAAIAIACEILRCRRHFFSREAEWEIANPS